MDASRGAAHATLIEGLRRRQFLAAGLGAVVAAAVPFAHVRRASAALLLNAPNATFQAFADTIIPGRIATRTDLGHAIHPGAIIGVDPLPGAVEADALALAHHPKIGFDTLLPVLVAELEARSLPLGGSFIDLDWDSRVAVCTGGLSFDNPSRTLWEASAAVPFTAFCAAAIASEPTAEKASGYRVMGLPGAAPNGYWDFSYRRRLARERTRTGNLD